MGKPYIGIGGWSYEPWRTTFYPPGLPHSRELQHASRQVSAIEVNGTFYSTFKPATFKAWHDQTPDGFVFTLKAHRSTTNRRDLGTAAESVARFIGSGIAQLGNKLGPILWQFMPTKVFEPAEFESFLALLPRDLEGRPLRHVLEVRHASFGDPRLLPLVHRWGCVVAHTDSLDYPRIADAQAPFAYLRLVRAQAGLRTGYLPAELDAWARGAQTWCDGGRDLFCFFINGAKERAPAAAQELIRRIPIPAAPAPAGLEPSSSR